MSLNKANFFQTLWAASLMILWTQSCALHKNLTEWWQWDEKKTSPIEHIDTEKRINEKDRKVHNKLIRKLTEQYAKSGDGWTYYGKHIVDFWKYSINDEWRFADIHGKMEDFYTERFHSIGKKEDSLIGHIEGDGDFFSKRKLFYEQVFSYREPYGLIIRFGSDNSRDQTFKIYDTIEVEDFDGIINTTEKDVKSSYYYEWWWWWEWQDNEWAFKSYVSKKPKEEKILWFIPEHYYDLIKNHKHYETYGTLLEKPSKKTLKYADKHGFLLKPKVLILRNIDSYDTNHNNDLIELRGIYIRIPEKKPETKIIKDTLAQIIKEPIKEIKKDTIVKIAPEPIKETEKKMNEIFNYGQKVIFESNSKEFSDKKVEQWLDKLYELLVKNPTLKIKITGYFWGEHSALPLERAEKVKQYLVKKWISIDRIQTAWGQERIAQSIKIEIIK